MDIAAWKQIADLGMGMVSLVALVGISLRLLTIINQTHAEVQAISLEIQRVIGYMQAYLNCQKNEVEETWTGKQS